MVEPSPDVCEASGRDQVESGPILNDASPTSVGAALELGEPIPKVIEAPSLVEPAPTLADTNPLRNRPVPPPSREGGTPPWWRCSATVAPPHRDSRRTTADPQMHVQSATKGFPLALILGTSAANSLGNPPMARGRERRPELRSGGGWSLHNSARVCLKELGTGRKPVRPAPCGMLEQAEPSSARLRTLSNGSTSDGPGGADVRPNLSPVRPSQTLGDPPADFGPVLTTTSDGALAPKSTQPTSGTRAHPRTHPTRAAGGLAGQSGPALELPLFLPSARDDELALRRGEDQRLEDVGAVLVAGGRAQSLNLMGHAQSQ